MPAVASSTDQFAVFVSHPRFRLGEFANFAGGNRSADIRRYRPGGMRAEEVGGGNATRDDITVSRPWRRDVDARLARQLDRRTGKMTCNVTKQPLDDEGKRWGAPDVYSRCVLIGVNHPDVDADGGDETAMLELVFAAGGEIG